MQWYKSMIIYNDDAFLFKIALCHLYRQIIIKEAESDHFLSHRPALGCRIYPPRGLGGYSPAHVELELNDYPLVVKHPMNLLKIQDKLKAREYRTI